MFAKSLTVPFLIATSVLAIPTVVRRQDVPLSNWQSQNLESYWTFKMRFDSLNCASQTGTDFYTTCCYPLAAGQSVSSLPAECTPTTCAAPPTQSQDPVPTETDPAPTETDPAPTDPAPAPTQSSTDDDDDQDCDDGDDDDGDDDTSSTDGNGDPTPQDDAPTPTDNGDPSSSSSQDDSQPTQDSQDTGSPDTSDANTNNVNTGGFATYYYQNGNAGACGQYHSDNDLIAAIDIDRYGDDSQVSPLCGQRVHITNTNNGNSVDVIIADVCPTCDNGNSIDLSYAAFSQLADPSEGQVPISWYFE